MIRIKMTAKGCRNSMKAAMRSGVDPYNSWDTFASKAARALADKARRMRDPYPFHRSEG